jgi:Na+/proline symporter
LNPFVTYTVWSGLFAGVFQILAFQGTDQLLVQRLLSARTKNESRAAVMATAIIVTFQYLFFLIIGVGLYVFFQRHPLSAPLETTDQVLPYFIVNYLPAGIAGLVVAGLLAAQMSGATLNSMASTTVVDFYPGAEQLSEKYLVRLARGFTAFWALVIIGLAFLARKWGSVVEAGITVLGITYGSLLGIFLLGILTKIRNGTAALIGMGTSVLTMIAIHFLTPIPFTWYFAIGTLVSFGVSWGTGQFLSNKRESDRKEEVTATGSLG